MRRRWTWMALLCLLLAVGCGERTGSPSPEAGDRTGIAARMALVQPEDIVCIDSRAEVTADALAAALHAAADYPAEQAEMGFAYYSLEVYLSGSPEMYSSDDEHFTLDAGLAENLVEVRYYGQMDARSRERERQRLLVEDETLYRLVRESCRTEERFDTADYTRYQELLCRRAEDIVEAYRAQRSGTVFSGFAITDFYRRETFVDGENTYAVYVWEPAFTVDEPDRFVWAGGTWLDAEARVRGYEPCTFFVVRDPDTPAQLCRFLPWDIYAAGDGADAQAMALRHIRQAFAPQVSVAWYEEGALEEGTYEEFTPEGAEPERRIVFTAARTVREFTVLAVTPQEADGGGPVFSQEALYRMDELTPERPLVMGLFSGDPMSAYGISYVDDCGATRRFTVDLSGADGAPLLSEV